MKICQKCKIEYIDPDRYFGKCITNKDGLQSYCKKCRSEYNKSNHGKLLNNKRNKKYRKNNPDKIRESNKKYVNRDINSYKENRKKISILYRKNNTDKVKSWIKKWKDDNKDKIITYEKDKLANDNNFKISKYLRIRLSKALKSNKNQSALILLGCSISEFKLHLESLFQEGMTWDNYGLRGWHVDHIRPCISFDLTNVEEQRSCFHYTNLQPLWSIDNQSKGSLHEGKRHYKNKIN